MIEGKATIELTDVHTGQKETVVEKNMVTNLIPYFFSDNVLSYRSLSNRGLTTPDVCPIYQKLMGGLLLFEEPLEENVDNLYAPRSNRCVGCANQDVNTTDNVMRGSLNVTESKKLPDGHQFVWDFATHQGNGTVSALALTHPDAGVEYWGGSYLRAQKKNLASWAYVGSTDINSLAIQAAFTCVMEMNVGQKYLAMIYPDFVSKELVIEKRYLPVNEYSIFEDVASTEFSYPLLDTHRITPILFSVTASPYKMNFFSYGEYWYGFGVKSSTSSQSVLSRLKIKKADCSVTEDDWTLSGVYANDDFARIYAKNQCPAPGDIPYFNGTVADGYYYFHGYNSSSQSRVFKLNLENPNDFKEIPLQNGNESYPNVIPCSQFNDCIFTDSQNYAIINDILQSDPLPIYTYGSDWFTYTRAKSFQYHHTFFTFGAIESGSEYSRRIYVTWMLPYLATINNLTTPVEKTPDKTMKITYTLRMVDEGAGT